MASKREIKKRGKVVRRRLALLPHPTRHGEDPPEYTKARMHVLKGEEARRGRAGVLVKARKTCK